MFAGFDADAIAAFEDADVERLMAEPGSCATGCKIEATLTNARATVALRERGRPGGVHPVASAPTMQPAPATTEEMAATSPESVALSKALKKRGFAFVGPTTMYALMQAIGLVDDHLVGCHRRGCADAVE